MMSKLSSYLINEITPEAEKLVANGETKREVAFGNATIVLTTIANCSDMSGNEFLSINEQKVYIGYKK